jgi:hypothetical protein
MDVELTPEQPPAVAETLAALLEEQRVEPDPWWRAGVQETLDP